VAPPGAFPLPVQERPGPLECPACLPSTDVQPGVVTVPRAGEREHHLAGPLALALRIVDVAGGPRGPGVPVRPPQVSQLDPLEA